jgi:subtilisin family serine protease
MRPGLPFEYLTGGKPPQRVQGYVVVRPGAGQSVFSSAPRRVTKSRPFHAKKADRDEARRALEKSGFAIIAESPLGYAVSAPAAAYEELTKGHLELRKRLMQAEGGRSRYVTHIDIVGDRQPKTVGVGNPGSRKTRIEAVVIERPRIFHGVFPSPLPPQSSRFHLRVPDDVAVGLGALPAQRSGHVGAGVNVAMPDSGQYGHPFFRAHGYDVRPAATIVPGTAPEKDPIGHGTGESSNILALAPAASLQPIRATDDEGNLVGAVGGFLKAKELKPQIITCSWGGDQEYPPAGGPDSADEAFALEILDAVERGIVVVFSAGNGGFTIEPQVPGVISAGGAYMTGDLELRASDYASGYQSPWYPEVTVPTVCGLVGMRPRAQYLMLPVQPGCLLDVGESEPDPPHDAEGDGTLANDGWALFSGTSAAAPQVAGAVALLLGAKPKLTPAEAADCLTHTAIDVTEGRCHPRFNNEAKANHDLATGYGLVNAAAAIEYAEAKY